MAIFPGSVATDAGLYVAVNNLSTLLTDNPLTIGATTVNVISTTGFPTAGAISIGAEIIFYTNKTASSFTGCTRGADGTSAAAHALNDQVDHNVIAFHHNGLKDEVIAVESFLSTHIGLATTVTAAEFQRLSGVTSPLQTQINTKAPLASPVFTGVVTIPTPFTLGATSVTATGAEINHLVGVTSPLQAQINTKATDTLVVHLAGTETLTGAKTLNSLTLGGNAAGGGFKFTGLGAGSANGDSVRYEQVSRLWTYARPVLEYVSATTVDVSINDPATSSTSRLIIFPDGDARSINSSTLYRFDITRNAVFNGSNQSGLRTSLSETNNTWYALYAVKASNNSTEWVTVGDTTLPIVANYSTLNSAYGTNGWVYLGLIRNGNVGGQDTDIVQFLQVGNTTIFRSGQYALAAATRDVNGVRFAATSSVASLTYTTTNGTGSLNIPNNIGKVLWLYAHAQTTREMQVSDSTINVGSGASMVYQIVAPNVLGAIVAQVWLPQSVGAGFGNSGGTSGNGAIVLQAWTDKALGLGSNPLV